MGEGGLALRAGLEAMGDGRGVRGEGLGAMGERREENFELRFRRDDWGRSGLARRRLGEGGLPLCFPFPALLFKSSGGVHSSLRPLVD